MILISNDISVPKSSEACTYLIVVEYHELLSNVIACAGWVPISKAGSTNKRLLMRLEQRVVKMAINSNCMTIDSPSPK